MRAAALSFLICFAAAQAHAADAPPPKFVVFFPAWMDQLYPVADARIIGQGGNAVHDALSSQESRRADISVRAR